MKVLNSSFLPENTQNKYIFIGTVGKKKNEAGDLTVDFKVRRWYIVGPITRNENHFRDIYAPKSYLTVYDYINLHW